MGGRLYREFLDLERVTMEYLGLILQSNSIQTNHNPV